MLMKQATSSLKAAFLSTDDQFVPQMIHAVIDVIVDHLNSEYPKLISCLG